jgi:hypothetical protein
MKINESNKKMSLTNKDGADVEFNASFQLLTKFNEKNNESITQESLKSILRCLNRLVINPYFQSMYLNNEIVRVFFLNSVQTLIKKQKSIYVINSLFINIF